jgi:hypothetical protein
VDECPELASSSVELVHSWILKTAQQFVSVWCLLSLMGFMGCFSNLFQNLMSPHYSFRSATSQISEITKHFFTWRHIHGVQWLYVSILRSYFWGHSQSEMTLWTFIQFLTVMEIWVFEMYHVQAGMDVFIGKPPCTFLQCLTGNIYGGFLQIELWTLLENVLCKHYYKCTTSKTVSPYVTRNITHCLNEQFPDWWIIHSGPQTWPPWSLNLSLLDFCLWGYIENMVYEHKVNITDELLHWIFYAARHVSDTVVLHKVILSIVKSGCASKLITFNSIYHQ